MKNSENQITVLGGSLGIIIMLLAISNYLNMMSESIQNRSKEFAILESIGMTRKQIKDYLTSQGANVTGSVSKKTDLVIVGENPGSKYTKAVDLGISIMNESAFKEKIISN